MAQYGDIEKMLVAWGKPRYTDVRFCTELPATLPPLITQFTRYGGTRSVVGFDVAQMDIDYYAPTREQAFDLAETMHYGLWHDLPGFSASGVLFLSAELTSAPSWAPYDNTNVRRTNASYLIRTRNTL